MAIQGVKSLYKFEGIKENDGEFYFGEEIVFANAEIKFPKEKSSYKRKSRYSNQVVKSSNELRSNKAFKSSSPYSRRLRSKIERLSIFNTQSRRIIDQISTISNEKTRTGLLDLAIDFTHHPLLENISRNLSRSLKKTVYPYKDREEFIEYLQKEMQDCVILRIDMPTVCKYINDHPDLGYKAGNLFIVQLYVDSILMASEHLESLRTFMKGPDLYIPISVQNGDIIAAEKKAQEIRDQFYAKWSGYYSVSTKDRKGQEIIPLVPAVVFCHIPLQEKGRQSSELNNEKIFSGLQEVLQTLLDAESSERQKNYYKENSKSIDWRYLSRVANPFDAKRGLRRLRLLGIKNGILSYIAKLYKRESENLPFVQDENLEKYMVQMQQAFTHNYKEAA